MNRCVSSSKLGSFVLHVSVSARMESIRKWVQSISFFLTNGYWGFLFSGTIYQGPLKVLCSPGLNCYSCPAATTFCPIGSLQQLLLGLRLTLPAGQFYFGAYVVGCMGMLGALCGRMICGWVCPFGLFQELLHKIPTRKFAVASWLRWGKYLFLLFFVIVLPLTVLDSFAMGKPWFCQFICPVGTLQAGIPLALMQPDIRHALGILYVHKVTILFLFIVWSVYSYRPFCRTTCPLGAFYGLFNGVSLIRLKFNKDNCTKCGACHAVCPVDIRFNETPNSRECIGCLQCSTKACQFNAISLEIGGHVLNSAPPPSDKPVQQTRSP
jgi:ferredoxin-type protein NapH